MEPSEQAEQFLSISGEFRLGELVTEQPHPRTRDLSRTAGRSIPDALKLLFDVDADVVEACRKWLATGAPERIRDAVVEAVLSGRKVFFTGCGATGRLSILLETIWRGFWQQSAIRTQNPVSSIRHPLTPGPLIESIMAGGDYALIKSVEGFEDFARFGAKQIEDAGVSEGDVVFAITEGGETSFVIGTAWKGLEKGAKVYFVYCNPDDVLRRTVARSREVLDEPRIEKMNLTTGPMAIMGSTRMQATSVQLCAMLTILEMAARDLCETAGYMPQTADVAGEFTTGLLQVYSSFNSQETRGQLAELVALEEAAYRSGCKSVYFAGALGVDVLTDTTERSPTFCTPAFRKWDDHGASESWAFLHLPCESTEGAWEGLLKRPPYGIAWTDEEVARLIGPEGAERQARIMRQIGTAEILRFRIGLDGLKHRPVRRGDHVVSVLSEREATSLTSRGGFFRMQIEKAVGAGASAGLVFLGREKAVEEVRRFLASWQVRCAAVLVPLPESGLLLDGFTRIGVKMLLNALSTCIMVRMGRVLGNCMVAVVPSNLKLIDRSTRYVQALTCLPYEDACRLLFESIEHVRPRMEAGQAYPPVVELTVKRWQEGCTLEEAEEYLVI